MVKLRIVVCSAVFLTAACSAHVDTHPVTTDDPSSAAPTPTAQCSAVLPDEAFTALGWPLESVATQHAGRCERRADGLGGATVATEALTAGGSTPAVDALETECAKLVSREHDVELHVTWLGPEVEDSCFAGLADNGTGVAELLFVNSVDELVQVRLEVLEPLDLEQAQLGVAALADAAAGLSD